MPPDEQIAIMAMARSLYRGSDPRPLLPLLPHLRVVTEAAMGRRNDTVAAELCGRLGVLLQAQGDLASARRYLERALAICEQVLGPEHPTTDTSLNTLGVLLQDQGDLVGARLDLERALAIRDMSGRWPSVSGC